jgi:hypothetical protein
MLTERGVDGDAPAKEGCRDFRRQVLWDLECESAVYPDAVGKAAGTAYAGGNGLGAEILIAAIAPLATETASALPPYADTRPDLEMRDECSLLRDRAYDLVTWDQRIRAGLPVVVDQMEVAVTDSAMRNLYIDIVRTERIGLVVKRSKRRSGLLSSVRFDADPFVNSHDDQAL